MTIETHEDLSLMSGSLNVGRQNEVRDYLQGKKIRVSGIDYYLFFIKRLLERHNISGQTDLFNNNIIVEYNLTAPELLSTILHEVLEIINRKYVLNLEHDLISKIEYAMFAALVDNPQLLEAFSLYVNGSNKTKAIKRNAMRRGGNGKENKETKKKKSRKD